MRPFLAILPVALCLALQGCVRPPGNRPAVWSGGTAGGLDVTRAPVLTALREADVIYVGEAHDDDAHHAYEARLLQALSLAKLPFAVGWEMFDRSQQPLLDRWDRRQINLPQLFEATGFQRTWGIYSPWYRRILEETRRCGISNLALNAPPVLVHKVARGDALTPEEKALLPRGFHVENGAFQSFASMMGAHPGAATDNLRHFFAAQSVWEQTMAASIVDFRVRHPATKVMVLTGRGHLQGGFGIPSYVAQKLNVHQLVLFPRGNSDR